MALLDYSDDFNLDDDGILRDSKSSIAGFLIDDDGIVRDDFDTHSKYTGTGHWTDSGLGADKHSAGGSTSTLRQLDLQSYPSFEDVSHQYQLEESNVNISDFEASKDELSFDRDSFADGFENELEYHRDSRGNTPQHFQGHYSGRSSRSSFDHSLNFEDTDHNRDTLESGKELFDQDYYQQLQELGVIIDPPEVELSNKESLHEFETVEAHVSHELIDFNENDIEGDPIQEFLRRTPTREVRERRASDAVVPDLYSRSSHRQDHDDEAHAGHTRPNTASSTRTISSRSFPEISPEEALQLYQDQIESQDHLDQSGDFVDNDADSIEFEESQKNGDVDEIFIITGRISDAPIPAKIPAYENERDVPSVTPRSEISNRESRRGQGHTSDGRSTQERKGHSRGHDRSFDGSFRSHTPNSADGSVTPVSSVFTDSRPPTRSDNDTPFRPESSASNRSSASEVLGARPKTKNSDNLKSQKLGKARSQESFFEHGKTPGRKDNGKMPKRLLPKPGAPEDQSFRVKSKSTTNISNKPGPVKPTHMSVSDIPHINIDDDDQSEVQSTTSEKSRTELTSKLSQEFSKRKQATELVKQLQLDYDKLLSKYATAELTIDQLRLGARIHLHANSPTPSQATSGSLPPPQRAEAMMVNQSMSRGMKSPSPFQGSVGTASPQSFDSVNVEYNGHDGPRRDSFFGDTAMVTGNVGPPQQRTTQEAALSTENGAESVKIGLMFQSRSLDDRMESFRTLLDEGQLTHEEQEKVFDKIRTDHEKLRRDYLQSKEDYNVLKRSSSNMTDVNFDDEKELEGELFRLGMKFDDIHEKVDENMKEKSSQRQPFQTNRKHSADNDGDEQDGRSIDQMKKKLKGTKAGDDLVQPRDDKKLNKNLARLHEEYNALMDRYRRLKQMAQTPERDQEIDNLVRKLRHICDEEPDIFKMPHVLEERRRRSSTSSRHSNNSTLNEERWEQLQEQEKDSIRGRRSSDTAGRKDSVDRRGQSSPTAQASRSSANFNGDIPNAPYQQLHRNHSDDISSSFSSRGWSPRDDDRTFDRDSPGPNLPRPRRHDHPDRERKLRKRPEAGSLSSLQDSGISEHEGTGGASGGGSLSNLPGPGKFKEMTKQRNAPDADSGFIGSMVGSEVSQRGRLTPQQQQQPSLRLRHPDDTQNRRPSSRGSSASSTRSNREDRPPSRGSLKGSNQRDHAGQAHDYTDDSYTLTESDMSFEADNRPRRRSQNVKSQSSGVMGNTIEEEDEDVSVTFTSADESIGDPTPPTGDLQMLEDEECEHPKQKQVQQSPRQQKISKNRNKDTETRDKVLTPRKSSRKQANVSASSGSVFLDDDLTPRATPNVSFNDTKELYSDDDEPRQVPSNSIKTIEAQKTATVSRSVGDKYRPPTPGAKVERKSPMQSVQTETLNQARELERFEQERQSRMFEDRAVGSDSDDTLQGSEHGTAATRGSNSSSQFRILQDEIGRLREEFQRATQQPPQIIQQPPLPVPQQPQQQNNDRDYYFDPTEDPYAFMRGPRRRANSFSGAVTRDYDEWWKYPLQQQHNEDIPLGYAAADSYATPRIVSAERSQEPPSRANRRERLRRRYRRTAEHEVQTANGYDSDQSPTRVPATTLTNEQLMNYYVPQYTSTQPQQSNVQQTPQTHYTSQVPQPRVVHRYSSQPNLSTTSARHPSTSQEPHIAAPHTQNVPQYQTNYVPMPSQPRRFQRRSIYRTPNASNQRTYSYDDIDVQGHQPVTYVLADQVPVEGQGHAVNGQVYTETAACPMCGGSGYHTHGDYVHEVPVSGPMYVLESPQRVRPRGRSKSATRYRHYSPDGRRRARYHVREYRSESSSAESDDTEVYRPRRRSRSAGRQRQSRRRYRKYRKDSDFEDALNESLHLTEDIDDLTRKMTRTVKSELGKYKRRKEFGSSIW